LQVSKTAHR
jgi:superoxide dismutase, Cu-Zn family